MLLIFLLFLLLLLLFFELISDMLCHLHHPLPLPPDRPIPIPSQSKNIDNFIQIEYQRCLVVIATLVAL